MALQCGPIVTEPAELVNMRLQILYETTGDKVPDVDIVAIHGLNLSGTPYASYARDTWRKPSGPTGHLWLRDALPKKIPNARVMLFSYDSTPSYTPKKLVRDASALLEALAWQREKCPTRPLLLMGHDLGGILIKQVLFQTMASADPKHKDTLDAIFAIVFFGTPHQGPAHIPRPVAGFKKFAEDLKKSFGITGMPSDLMAALQTAGMFDLGLEDSWHAQKGRYRFLSVCETMNATVPRSSATLGLEPEQETVLAMVADHQGICRFDANDNIARSNLDDLLLYLSQFCRAHMRNKFLKKQRSFAYGP